MHITTFSLLLCIAICINVPTNAMQSAQVVWQPDALVPLKNGGQALAQTVFNTHLAALKLIDNNGAFAAIELIQACRDNQSEISPQAGTLLRQYGLVNEEHKPVPALKNILLSMAKGDGPDMKLVNPEKLH